MKNLNKFMFKVFLMIIMGIPLLAIVVYLLGAYYGD